MLRSYTTWSFTVVLVLGAVALGMGCSSNRISTGLPEQRPDASTTAPPSERDASFDPESTPTVADEPAVSPASETMQETPLDSGAASSSDNSLVGTDSDSDGVRDDIEKLIDDRYPRSARTRAALYQSSEAMGAYLRDADDAERTRENAESVGRAADCIYAMLGVDALEALAWLHAEFHNTLERTLAYIQAQRTLGAVVSELPEDPASSCAFEPSTFAD